MTLARVGDMLTLRAMFRLAAAALQLPKHKRRPAWGATMEQVERWQRRNLELLEVKGKCSGLFPGGRWLCLDCGRTFDDQALAFQHTPAKHRLAWECECGRLEGLPAEPFKPSGRAMRPTLARD